MNTKNRNQGPGAAGTETLNEQGRGVVPTLPVARGVYAVSACERSRALEVVTPSACRTSKRPEGQNLISPNGADPYQPRAERSAALGWTAIRNLALKGRSMGVVARENGVPLQGFAASPTPTQGDALGWNSIAPLGLNTRARCAPVERGVYAASACERRGVLEGPENVADRTSKLPEGQNLISPNGAELYQPRAEGSAALGWTTPWKIALKGRSTGGVMRCDGSPLQGFGPMPIPTQGDALGWHSIAPLGLDTGAGRAPAERGVHAASACELKETLAKTTPSTSRPSKRPEGRAPARRTHSKLWFLLLFILHNSSFILSAYPPAPHHLFYGMVRDEFGSPIAAGAEVILETLGGVQIKTTVIPNLEPGVNYRLAVPMDAGITSDLYKPTALRPTVPFLIRVRIGTVNYLPIEMIGDMSRMGQPGQRTLLNLTLGEDTDGDGLPDAWERLINSDLTKVRPGDDSDRDGLTNQQEYLAGTYAFDPKDGFTLNILRLNNGAPVLEFTAIRGHTYTLLGSPDLKTWTTQSFRIPAEGATAPTRASYPAADVRKLQIEAISDVGQPVPRFFRLLTQ